jgi:hypothetical protein
LASWIDPKVNASLAEITGSKAPIIRADWFLVNASRPPGYHDLLRLKTLNDFKQLAGFDNRAADRKEITATIVRSGSRGMMTPVARNNRLLARTPTFQGYFWETFDFLDSVKAKNVINNFLNIKEGEEKRFEVGELSGLNPKEWLKAVRKKLGFRDAAEWIATLPNGLQVYFITDGQDKRIDEGDIKVVFDSTSHDFRVINGRSCIWCHANGINPFKSQFQEQIGIAQMTDLGIFLREEGRAEELQQFIRKTFGSANFAEIVAEDQRLYKKAVAAVNGQTPSANASAFRSQYNEYDETDLDMNRICYELGLQEQEVRALITLRKDGVNSGVLLQQMLQPPIAIRRDHWEEVFPEIAILTTLLRKQ